MLPGSVCSLDRRFPREVFCFRTRAGARCGRWVVSGCVYLAWVQLRSGLEGMMLPSFSGWSANHRKVRFPTASPADHLSHQQSKHILGVADSEHVLKSTRQGIVHLESALTRAITTAILARTNSDLWDHLKPRVSAIHTVIQRCDLFTQPSPDEQHISQIIKGNGCRCALLLMRDGWHRLQSSWPRGDLVSNDDGTVFAPYTQEPGYGATFHVLLL